MARMAAATSVTLVQQHQGFRSRARPIAARCALRHRQLSRHEGLEVVCSATDSPAAAGGAAPAEVDSGLGSKGSEFLLAKDDSVDINRQLMEILAPKTDYLAEFLAIQNQQPRSLGFFGTRNMGFMHQQLIEVLAYAMLLTGNHIFTSGATGTNAAVIRGALRAEKPELLTVVLPQSMSKQPAESQELLQQVENIIEMPQNDELQLLEASRICNQDIVNRVQQVICFAFHDSNLLLETCQLARGESKPVCLFYLD